MARGLVRRLVVWAAILLTLANPAHAATYYYYRGGAQAASPSGSAPPSPAPAGTFAILVDGESFAVRGTAYSATTYAYGNAGQVVFSVQSGTLPAGISINATTGTISGTPATTGSSSFVIQGIDTANGATATSSMTLDVVDPFSISGAPAATVLVGANYSADFTLAGGGQPYGFSVGAIPPGLTFTSSGLTSSLEGAPTTAGAYPITVTGSESHGMTVQYPYTLTVVSPLTITGSPPASGTVGTPYSGQMVVSGGMAPYTFSLAAGALPTNVLLKSATGVIAGTPVTAGIKTGIRIKVTDSSGQSATSAPFSVSIAASGAQPLTIAGSPAVTATENTAYSAQFSAGGGATPYVYSLASGALPKGLTLNASSGLITGAPSAGTAGSYPDITVQVTDASAQIATANAFTLTVSAPAATLSITGNPSGNATIGTAYSALFSAHGGSGVGYTFASVGSALPPGLFIDSASGMLQGTPTTVGTYSNLKIRVTDSVAHTAVTTLFTITVTAPPPLAISGTPQTSVSQGGTYNATWTAFDGSGSGYHFSSVGAALPPGLMLADAGGAQGILSGAATVAGVYSGIQIQVTDSANNVATSAVFTITVTPPALTISGAPPAQANVGTSYATQFAASGGTAPYLFSLSTGTLPPGLTLDSSGHLAGTPTSVGSYSNIVVKVTDASSATAFSTPFQIEVTDTSSLALVWSPRSNWNIGDQFSATVTANGGSGALTFSYTGTLPPGVIQDPNTGALSGTVIEEGSFGPVTITATDGLRNASSSAQTFVISYPDLTVAGSPATTGTIGSIYNAQFTATGGTNTGFIYSMVGALPSGLTLDPATGIITGSPTTAGSFTGLAVKATDSALHSGTSDPFTITVASALSVAGTPASTTTIGSAYLAQFTATGGVAPYSWSMVGTLPAGLSLNASSGQISGTSSSTGTFTGLAVKVTDSAANSATSAPFSITVTPALTISGTPQTSVVYGEEPYSSTFTAIGGTGSGYVWSVVGTLPPGVTMNASTGVLSAPSISISGTYPGIRVRVTDSGGAAALSAPFTITITEGFQLIANPQSQVVVGAAYFSNFGMAAGKAPYSISATGLPPGLNFSTTATSGSINGSPTDLGDYDVTVTATDALNAIKTYAFTLHVQPPLSAQTIPDATITEGDTFTAQLTPNGGASPYILSTAGTLPPGLSFNSDTGVYAGRAAAGSAGTYAGIIGTITDNLGYVAHTPPFTITVLSKFMLTGTPPNSVQAGQPYAANFLMSGGQGPYEISVTGLPSGLSLTNTQPTASITGSTADAGPYPIIVTATDARGASQSISYTLNVTPVTQDNLSIFGNPPTTVVLYQTYNTQFVAQGGTGTGYVYSVIGTLPDGIALDPSTGILLGEPWETGVYPDLQVSVTDSAGATAVSQIFQIEVVDDPALMDMNIDAPNIGYETEPYSAQVTAFGGNGGPYTYETVPGFELPAGIWIDQSTGAISGAVEYGHGGWFYSQILAYDSDGNYAISGFSVNFISQPSISVDDIQIQEGNDLAYAYQYINASGGDGNLTYTLNGTVPSGVTMDPVNGYLVGTPPIGSAGNYPHLTITVTDVNGRSKTSAEFTLNVTAIPAPPPVQVGAPISPQYYTFQLMTIGINASGGAGGPYTIEVLSALPPGLSFNGSSNISGTPQLSALGEWTVTLKATDRNGSSATADILINIVNMPILVGGSGPTAVNAGSSYNGHWSASYGSRTGYVYNIIGTLPPGLSLSSSTGDITGTVDPGASGLYDGLQVGVTDSVGGTGVSAIFGIMVHGQTAVPLAVYGNPPTSIASGSGGFQTQFYADGGTGTGYVFTAVGDGNMSFDMSQLGKLWVYSATLGSHTYTITVTDSQGTQASREFSLNVYPGIQVNVPTPIVGMVAQPLSDVFAQATGGTGGYTYTLSPTYSYQPSFPDGITLDPISGKISGTPTTVSNVSNYVIQVKDSSGAIALSNYFSINITGQLKLTGVPDQDAYLNEDYQSTKPVTSGGVGSAYYEKTYEIVQGALPPGLSLDSHGFVTGNPTATGEFKNIQIQVTDTDGATALSDVFEIDVHPPRGDVSPVYAWYVLPYASYQTLNVAMNTAISIDVQANGGRGGPYSFSATPGYQLPPGLSINASTGQVSGTLSSQGTYRISVRATDSITGMKGDTGPLMISVSDLAITGQDTDVTILMGGSVSIHTVTSGGRAPFTYRRGGGDLPISIGVDPSTGMVIGYAGQGTIPGAYTYTVMVTDADGKTADTGPMNITVNEINGCIMGSIGPYGVIGGGLAGGEIVGIMAAAPYGPDAIGGTYGSIGTGPEEDPTTPGIAGPYGVEFWNAEATPSMNPVPSCGQLGPSYVDWVYPVELDDPGSHDVLSGSQFVMSLSAHGGKQYGGLWYTASPLPAGLSIDHDTGVISGTVLASSGFTATKIIVMDAYGITDQKMMYMNIRPSH